MVLRYGECECFGNIMRDFAKFDKVSDYLQAVLDVYKTTCDTQFEMLPLDCGFKKPNGEFVWIIQFGQIAENAQKHISWLSRQRVKINIFISDDLVIKADGFEREYYFSRD